MSEWFFTADTHFDHPYMATKRGFGCVTEMDKLLIKAWNNKVTSASNVVVAGDFFWTTLNINYFNNIMKKLKGNKIFVRGNHDRRVFKKTGTQNKPMYHRLVKTQGVKQFIAVSHYPMRSWDRARYGAWNLHGHCHADLLPWKNQLDVGVDSAKLILGEYEPFSFEEVWYLLKGKELNGQ